VTLRVCAAVAASAVGAALLASACTSSSGSPHKSSQAHSKPRTNAAFAFGSDPCQLVKSPDISAALQEQTVKQIQTKSTCKYVDAKTGDYVSISTAVTTPSEADHAVTSAASSAGAKVQNLHGVGDSGIAYVTTTPGRSVATCVIAKNGTILFMYGSGQDATRLLTGMIALATTATGRV
jgi:hypothetical protein